MLLHSVYEMDAKTSSTWGSPKPLDRVVGIERVCTWFPCSSQSSIPNPFVADRCQNGATYCPAFLALRNSTNATRISKWQQKGYSPHFPNGLIGSITSQHRQPSVLLCYYSHQDISVWYLKGPGGARWRGVCDCTLFVEHHVGSISLLLFRLTSVITTVSLRHSSAPTEMVTPSSSLGDSRFQLWKVSTVAGHHRAKSSLRPPPPPADQAGQPLCILDSM